MKNDDNIFIKELVELEINLNIEIRTNISTIRKQFVDNGKEDIAKDSLNYSKIMDALDNFLDLGDSNVWSWLRLSGAEQEKYWQILSKVIKKGIIGYRYYEVNGQLERHFIEYEMGNPRFSNAKIKYVNKKQYSMEWLV